MLRKSLELAHLILQQHHFPPRDRTPFLDASLLSSTRVLELGSGTGVLAVLLSHLVAQWIATDQAALLPLIRKNLAAQNQQSLERVLLDELDWVEAASAYARRHSPRRTDPKPLGDSVDLILAADCLYNEALVKPLLHTISYHAGQSTVVVVVSELRSSDVMLSFLSAWLELDQNGWEVWRASSLGPEFDEGQNVIWVGRRRETATGSTSVN
jgi:SAM-dependent methyltransferase